MGPTGSIATVVFGLLLGLAAHARAQPRVTVRDVPACDAARFLAAVHRVNVVCLPTDRRVSFTTASSARGAFEALATAADLASDQSGHFYRVAPPEAIRRARGSSLRGGRAIDVDFRSVHATSLAELVSAVARRPISGAPSAVVAVRARNVGSLELLGAAISLLGGRPVERGRAIELGPGPSARAPEGADAPCSGDVARFALLPCADEPAVGLVATATGARPVAMLVERAADGTIALAVVAHRGDAVGRRALADGQTVLEAHVGDISADSVTLEWRGGDGTVRRRSRLTL